MSEQKKEPIAELLAKTYAGVSSLGSTPLRTDGTFVRKWKRLRAWKSSFRKPTSLP